jgi:ankyrin repeat protein
VKNKYGFTPLHVASTKGNGEVVRELLKKGANMNIANQYGFTPLYIANQEGHVNMLRDLLSRGANVNTANKTVLLLCT